MGGVSGTSADTTPTGKIYFGAQPPVNPAIGDLYLHGYGTYGKSVEFFGDDGCGRPSWAQYFDNPGGVEVTFTCSWHDGVGVGLYPAEKDVLELDWVVLREAAEYCYRNLPNRYKR